MRLGSQKTLIMNDKQPDRTYLGGVEASTTPGTELDRVLHERKQRVLYHSESRLVRWVLEPMPDSMFAPQYWLGIFAGLIVGLLIGGAV